MAIKLLTKSEVVVLKGKERQAEIQEGVKLARRVDNLREVAAQEEASLEAFRNRTVAIIKADIDDAVQERDRLHVEIRKLIAEREVGMKPVEAAMRELTLVEHKLEKDQAELNRRMVLLRAKEQEVATQTSHLEIEKRHVESLRSSVQNLAKIAIKNEEKTVKALEKADKAQKATTTLLATTEAELRARDAATAAKERDNKNWETRLAKEEATLRKQAIKLADRERTLEREFYR